MKMIRMITRRDLVVALVAVVATLGVVAAAQQPPAVQKSTTFEWAGMMAKDTEVGSVRQVLRAPTPTLKELEMHITTLKPGLASHPPHHHPNEELIIIREGTVETLSKGEWKRLGPGSIIFNASNEEHALRNVGPTPATYHVVNWTTSATPPK
jgi:XRE family transcriptional regulator, regulator of sulfur utilization